MKSAEDVERWLSLGSCHAWALCSIRALPDKGPVLRCTFVKSWLRCWLTHSPFRAGSACGKKPFPHLQGVKIGWGFVWAGKFLSVHYPGRLRVREQSLQLLGFQRCWLLPFSHGSWGLTGFLDILVVHQYLALWKEEIGLSVNMKCAELKPAVFRVFNYQAIQSLPLWREIF